MILTKLKLTMYHAGNLQCIRDCQDMHRTIMSAFDSLQKEQPRAKASILYRMIPIKEGAIVYLTSEIKPDLNIYIQKGILVEGTRSLDALQGLFVLKSNWRFDLLTMPSKKIESNTKNSKRSYLNLRSDRENWLFRKGEQNGFRVLYLEERGEQNTSGYRKKNTLHFSAIQFGGILEVTNEQLFWQGFKNGIGPERAYGLGMLMLSGV